ncbi:MAG TPA: deaminase [Candidatus Binatia bacterium]
MSRGAPAARARRARVKDGRPENTHPLNRGTLQDRVPLFESYLRFAEALARCSPETTDRAGCVLVSFNLERVLGAGFSGGAVTTIEGRGRGRSSHLHAEEHALLIAGAVEKDKLMFVTRAPCYLCAVRAINSGVSHVYYRHRGPHPTEGVELLRRAGKTVLQYPPWRPRAGTPAMPPRLPSRLTLPDAYQRFAEALALRSTDGVQKVGCVVVSADLERVLGVGYNGGAAGISDRAFIPSDRSGYVHAEENALLKAGAIEKDKTMFITHTPCVMCAKRAINSGVATVYCRQPNVRGDEMGLELLRKAGKRVVWWHRAPPRSLTTARGL